MSDRLGSKENMLTSSLNNLRRLSTSVIDKFKTDPRGLSVSKATFFIVGEMAGVAALVLPSKVVDIVISTVTLMVITCIAIFSGKCLSVSLSEALDLFTPAEKKEAESESYPVLVRHALGETGITLSRITNYSTLFGVTCIFINLCGSNISALIVGVLETMELSEYTDSWWTCKCFCMIATCIFVTPMTFMPSANDSWYLALIACWSSIISFILIAIQCFIQGINPADTASGYLWSVAETKPIMLSPFSDEFDLSKFAEMVHVFIFGFGGLSIFPAIQMEMREPRDFSIVNIISMISLCFLYSLVIIPGYVNFEQPSTDGIFANLDETSALSIIANVLITVHLVFALTIVAGPPMKALEKKVNEKIASRRNSILVAESQPLRKRQPQQRRESNLFTQPDVIPGMQQSINKAPEMMTNRWVRAGYMLAVLIVCLILPTPTLIGEITGFTTITMETFFFPALIYLVTVVGIKSFSDLKEIKTRSWYQIGNFALCLVVISIGIFSVLMGFINFIGKIRSGNLLGAPCLPGFWEKACGQISTTH